MSKDIKLGIIIDAKGNAAKNIGGISATLGKLGGIAGGVLTGGLVLAGAGVVALGAGLVSSVGAAMDAQQGQAQLAAVLKSTNGVSGMTADSINDLASSLQKVTTFEDDAILAGQNMLLTFTNIGKEVFPQATETILDMAQALGGDTVSNAKILGKALNDPVAGLTALGKAGVQFTDAQKDMIEAMVASGDIVGAQKMILAELETQIGDSAKAAGETLPGKLAILQNTFGDIQETIGGAFLPILSEVADMFTAGLHSEFVQGALESLTTFITGSVVPGIKMAGQIFGDLARYILFTVSSGDSLNDWIAHLPDAIKPAVKFIGDTIVAFQDLGNWFISQGIPQVQAFYQTILGQLTPSLQSLWTWVERLGEGWSINWSTIQESTAGAITFLQPYFEQLKEIINQFIIELLPPLNEAWLELQAVWADSIQPALAELWTSLQELFVALGFGAGKTTAWKFTLDILKFGLASVTTTVRALTPIIRALGEIISFSVFMTKSMVSGLTSFKHGLDGVYSAVSRLIGKIRDMANSLSNLNIPDWLTPGSPTPLEIGMRGIAGAASSVTGAMPAAFAGVAAGGAAPALAGAGVGGGGGMVINFTYSPVISLADRLEAEQVLAPFIANGVRLALAGKGH